MTHREIITKLGGIRSLARKLDHPVHTTVQGWFERNRIPLDRWAEVIAAANTEGFKINASDMMPVELRDDAA